MASVIVTVEPTALVAGANQETLSISALSDGGDGPRAVLAQGPVPHTQEIPGEFHTGWMEYGGGRGARLVPVPAAGGVPSPDEKQARGWAMTSTRAGEFVAMCQESTKREGARAVVVKKWEWVAREATGPVPAAQRAKWKGGDATPAFPDFDGREPIPAQLWLSDDGRTLAALLVDPEDYANRELYLLSRPGAAGKWEKEWKRKPELEPGKTAHGLNLSAALPYFGVLRVVFTDTPAMGRCCHVSHVWRRIEEGDPHRGDPLQLFLNIRALCISTDGGKPELELLRPDCWISKELPFNIGDKDANLPPLACELDPTGSILALVANEAEHQPLLFVGMPGFENLRRSVGPHQHTGGVETPLTVVELRDNTAEKPSAAPVQDLAWSHDGSLLAAISKEAQLFLLPRLGPPLPLRAQAATEEMRATVSEYVRPPAREAESAEAAMPSTERKTSVSMCPISTMYPYFDLGGVDAEMALAAGVGGGAGGVSTVGSQTAESAAGGAAPKAPQPAKLRLFTVCAHAKMANTFAVCDGSVAVVLTATTLDTRDASKPRDRQLIAQEDFSARALVQHLASISSLAAPAMANWPRGPLPSFAASAQMALALGLDSKDVDAHGLVAKCLASAEAKLKQRSSKGDLVPVWVKLQGDVLLGRPKDSGPWKPLVKLLRPVAPAGCPKDWLKRSGRELQLTDGRNPEVTLLCASDAEAAAWEKNMRAAAGGSRFRAAAALLRCSRKILQVLAWGQDRSPELAINLVVAAFHELLSTKQLYLAFHLLSTAEQYLQHTNAGNLVLTKQWELLRKRVVDAGKAWGAIEKKTTFGIDDPFWGYKDPVSKEKVSWGALETVIALRLCGRAEALSESGDQVERHKTRLKSLRSVADQGTHSPKPGTPQEYLAIGHRMYYEKRWTDAREFYKSAAAAGKTALFAIHVLAPKQDGQDFTAALKMANAGLHPHGAAAHLEYTAGKPCLKGDYAIVCAMAKLMHAVICGKPKFEMWRPTTAILAGAAPAAYVDNPKWYDGLSKRAITKAQMVEGASSCSADLWNAQAAVKLCLAAGLKAEATAILQKEPTVKSALGIVLRSHPEIINHMAEANGTVKQVVEKHMDNALRACDLQRIDKLLVASTKLFGEGDSRPRRLVVVKHFLRGMRQYFVKMPVPVVDSFQLPAPLERGLYQVNGTKTQSPVQLEQARRWNIGVVARFCCYVLQPAMQKGKIKQIMGDHGYCGAGAAKAEREPGEVGWIATFGTWGDFVLPYRLLMRFLWYQTVRDDYSSRWRQVHQLHTRRSAALARLRRGESLSYHRGTAVADEQELLTERIHLCCAAVQLLPFDDIIHINKLHEMLVTCIENIEREIAINDLSDQQRLRPLCTLLMIYLPEFGTGPKRHQVLRRQIEVRCTTLDSMLRQQEEDATASGLPAEQQLWAGRLTQQSEEEKSYGMWNYELDGAFQRFVARDPRLLNIEQATKFDFVPSAAAKGAHDLDPKQLTEELTKLKAEYEALSDGPPLVKGAGGQWVLPPEEIGYEVLDVAEWDASKEKEAEFEAVFDKKAEAAARQEELAYPVVDMKDGTAVGPQKEVGDKAIGDMTKTAPKPEAPAKAPAPAPKPVPSDQLPGGLQLLSRTGKREVSLGKTASHTGFFTTTVKTLRQDGPHARAKRVAGKTAAIIPPAGGVTGAHPITEPVPHKLHAARPTGQTEMRVGAPLPTQEYNVDPQTGAIVQTDGTAAEYPVASLAVQGYTPSGGWYGSDEGGRLRVAHRNWQGQRRPDGLWDEDPRGSGWDSEAGGWARRGGSGWDWSDDEWGDHGDGRRRSHPLPRRVTSPGRDRLGSPGRSPGRRSPGRGSADWQRDTGGSPPRESIASARSAEAAAAEAASVTIHVGGPDSDQLGQPSQAEDKQWQATFIEEMSKELGVSAQRLQLLWQ